MVSEPNRLVHPNRATMQQLVVLNPTELLVQLVLKQKKPTLGLGLPSHLSYWSATNRLCSQVEMCLAKYHTMRIAIIYTFTILHKQ